MPPQSIFKHSIHPLTHHRLIHFIRERVDSSGKGTEAGSCDLGAVKGAAVGERYSEGVDIY